MINLTDSVPVGLYFMDYDSEIQTGDIISFQLFGEAGEMMKGRGYVSDHTPLIKFVAGTKGDRFCIDSNRNFTINDGIIGKALEHDGNGQPLPRIEGCRMLAHDEILVVGSGIRSFDSRYFGPISVKNVVAKLKAISTKLLPNDGGV